jgi:hypothetical protein
MQSPKGNKIRMKLLGAGGTNGRGSYVAWNLWKHHGYLRSQVSQYLRSQASHQCVAICLCWSGTSMLMVTWSWRPLESLFHLLFRDQVFETFWDPPTFPCRDDDYNVVVCLPTHDVMMFDYHDDVTSGWIPLRQNFQNFKCYSLYVMLQFVDC